MPKVSRENARLENHGPVVDRCGELADYTVNFVAFHQDVDATPLLKGLPDDRCSCPHWGYVFTGKLTFRCGDREEVFVTGDAFYLPAGHIPTVEAGTEILQFSPTAALSEVDAVMQKNMRALQGG